LKNVSAKSDSFEAIVWPSPRLGESPIYVFRPLKYVFSPKKYIHGRGKYIFLSPKYINRRGKYIFRRGKYVFRRVIHMETKNPKRERGPALQFSGYFKGVQKP